MYMFTKFKECLGKAREVREATATCSFFVLENAKEYMHRFLAILKITMFLEVLHLLLGVGDDGVGAGLPAGRAHLAVLVRVLRDEQNFSS